MKRLTWSAILALTVLAVGTMAQAAVVDVTLTFNKTNGITVGETLTWQVAIAVSGNQYTAAGGPTVNLGVQAASIGLASSNAGVVEIEEGFSPVPPPGAFTGKPKAGTVVANTAAEPTGFGTQALPISPAYGPNRGLQPILLSGTITEGTDGWNATFTDVDPELKKGVGTGILHLSGTMIAKSVGTVTYTPSILLNGNLYNLSVYTMDQAAWSFEQRSVNNTTDTLNLNGATLTVVPEPTTIGLLGFGIVGALLRRRRRA